MIHSLPDFNPFRVLMPETIWLDSEQFDQARSDHRSLGQEPQQWQTYLNQLAQAAFATWLREQLPQAIVERQAVEIETATYLTVDVFRLCLIATEHVLDERVEIPLGALAAESAAHFYVVLEVLEEEEQVVIRGFSPYSQIIRDESSSELATAEPNAAAIAADRLISIPLSAFDPEINHLVFYARYTDAEALMSAAIGSIQSNVPVVAPDSVPTASASTAPAPTASAPTAPAPAPTAPVTTNRSIAAAGLQVSSESLSGEGLKTRLSQWLQGVVAEGWQTLDTLINPEVSLAWSTRQLSAGARAGKLINFGLQLGSQAVALLVTVTPEADEKINVGVQVLPVAGENYLPPHLKLMLLSRTAAVLQEVESREQDNYIQLRSFKGKPSTRFSIAIHYNDVTIQENFEL